MSNRALQYALRYGSAKHPVAEVMPDKTWPGMWRVRYDGNLSDMANLSRAKDAAMAIAERGPPGRNRQRLHWHKTPVGEPLRSPLVSPNAKGAPRAPTDHHHTKI
jgi:hypothetical protein